MTGLVLVSVSEKHEEHMHINLNVETVQACSFRHTRHVPIFLRMRKACFSATFLIKKRLIGLTVQRVCKATTAPVKLNGRKRLLTTEKDTRYHI